MQQHNPNLTCAMRLPGSGQHNPVIQLLNGDEVIASIDSGNPDPCIPVPGGTIHTILALDVLEHVQDEQTWMAEFARILAPGGNLTLRVPLENTLAWLDALNIYRYLSDTVGAGQKPAESMPLGWHRHYTRVDLTTLITEAGFTLRSYRTEGVALAALPHLASLVIGNLQQGHSSAKRELVKRRSGGKPRRLMPQPAPIAAYATVQAMRVKQGINPQPDLDPEVRPEMDAISPLE